MGFSFDLNRENPHDTIYDGYLGKPVRVDVAGGIGCIGIIKSCDIYGAGHIMRFSPHIYFMNKEPRVNDGEVIINTSGAPVSVFPIKGTLEEYVQEISSSIKDKDK